MADDVGTPATPETGRDQNAVTDLGARAPGAVRVVGEPESVGAMSRVEAGVSAGGEVAAGPDAPVSAGVGIAARGGGGDGGGVGGPHPGAGRVTIQDVARRCGVAPSTVSNALTGRRFVGPTTRALIERTAAELGYRPSGIARALRLKRTQSLALVVNDLSQPLSAAVALGVEAGALDQGYHTLICNTSYGADRESRHLDLLLEKQVDGVIIMSTSLDDTNVGRLQEARVPFVLLNRRHGTIRTNYVGVDSAAGTYAVVLHLLGLGHRRIAFIGGRPTDSSVTRDKITTFRAAMHGAGLPPVAIVETEFGFEAGVAAARSILDVAPADRPTALMAVNDQVALGAIEAALDLGLGVPSDLSVVGWDDAFPAALKRIALTSVRQPAHELGTRAVELLLRQIGSARPAPEQVIFPVELIVRGTTAPPPLLPGA